MKMATCTRAQPWAYRWRSSNTFIITTAMIALFTDNILYSFVVPIMSYIVEERLQLDASHTQRFTTAILTTHGLASLIFAPVIAHFADKTSNRRIPLLVSLVGCIIGTILVSLTLSVWTLFLGRILQAAAGSAVWITAFATLADNVGRDNMGKVMGLAMSFVTAGVTLGPVISGALLELSGYWSACAAPLALLTLDCILRLLMVDASPESSDSYTSPTCTETPLNNGIEEGLNDEHTRLITSDHDDYQSTGNFSADQTTLPASTRGFYDTVLHDPRIICGLVNTMSFSAILAAFDATLPLHLSTVFGWGSLAVGMIFLDLQIPGMFLGAAAGWVRGRLGPRGPTTVGWVILAPLLWLLATPGKFEWADPEGNGKALTIVCIIGIGLASVLLRGAGTFQVAVVTNELQSENPTIFGSHGGNSRIFGMTEMAFNAGMMLGPFVSGSLSEAFGYYPMNCVLAGGSLLAGLSSFLCFRSPRGQTSPSK